MPRRAPVSASAPPSPGRGMRTPSISRVFAAALLAIAVAGLVERWATWQSARRTQADMIDLTHRIERIAQLYPSPGIETQLDDLRELAVAVGDDAIQAAIATTILFAVMLVALGVGLWYNRRRLAQPFAHVVSALERVAAGHYEERLDETQPEEFGMIARGVNRMAGALAWREGVQDSTARLLAALNPAVRDPSGDNFGPALEVLAAATAARALVLYQPDYDSNEWRPAAAWRASAEAVPRKLVRELVGDAGNVIPYAAGAAGPIRERLRLAGDAAGRGSGGPALLPPPAQNILPGLPGAPREGPVPRQRGARAAHAAQLRYRLQRPAAHRGGGRGIPHGHAARLPRDDRPQRPPSAPAHQRAARHLEDRGRAHGPEARAAGARGSVPRGGRYRARPARRPPPQARDRPTARALHRARRPHPRPPGVAQPALQRHQVHARRRADHTRRRRGGWRPHRPGGGVRYRDRYRRRGPGEAVPRIRAGRRLGEPPLRRNGTGVGAVQAPRGAARRGDRRRVGARPGQYVLVHPSPGR